jgi:cytochrome c-type biogenesis protein CcmH/NrfG
VKRPSGSVPSVAPIVALALTAAAALALSPVLSLAHAAAPKPDFDESLPVLGMQLSELPGGPGQALAGAACLKCHSADILRQQRLDEKKWAASVNKMIGWGAEVPEGKKDELVAYLVKSFGPDNDRFRPLVTRPVGR